MNAPRPRKMLRAAGSMPIFIAAKAMPTMPATGIAVRTKPVATNALEEEWAATAGALLQAPGE